MAPSTPDGNDDFLTGEQWTLLSGPFTDIADATEEIASFTPLIPGVYVFELEISAGFDIGTDTVEITAIEAPRVSTGLQVLYTFEEGEGSQVTDQSNDPMTPTLDLDIQNPSNISWIPGGGMIINESTRISAADNKISAACSVSNEITIEAWVKPLNTAQNGPTRIVSLSSNLTNRNFTLGQEFDQYDARLRTTTTSANGTPSLSAGTVKTQLSHVVYTRQTDGSAAIYIDGVSQVVGTVSGNMSNWNNSYSLTLMNELTDDRGWLGEIYLAAVYCVALDITEVLQNFSAGAPGNAGIVPDSDGDGIVDCIDPYPGFFNNFCNGSDPVLENQMVTGEILCAATGSVTVEGSVETQLGGELQLMTPNAYFNPGFSVSNGGSLKVTSANPSVCP